ncbi:MAG: formyltransferase family protein [Magnetospirillum sp.]|nr:formyltransferase family protein [Magnetospirillum sp.]
MHIQICAYREWALAAARAVEALCAEHRFSTAKDPHELERQLIGAKAPDLICAIGWSWIFDRVLAESTWIVGVHPSDLPDFAGGSPIQNQILEGVTATKNTLFRITPDLDAGPILGKVPLSLAGHMHEIFANLTFSTVVLLDRFIRAFPDGIVQTPQVPSKKLRRLKPEAGRLHPDDFARMDTAKLFDFIRCREDPYPNAYMEDSAGILHFKRADFREKS